MQPNSIAYDFTSAIIEAMPEEGLQELNKLIDNDEMTESKLDALLEKYNIDKVAIMQKLQKEHNRVHEAKGRKVQGADPELR